MPYLKDGKKKDKKKKSERWGRFLSTLSVNEIILPPII